MPKIGDVLEHKQLGSVVEVVGLSPSGSLYVKDLRFDVTFKLEDEEDFLRYKPYVVKQSEEQDEEF